MLSTYQTSIKDISDSEKLQCLHYSLNLVHPFLKQICDEQALEEETEARIQGMIVTNISGGKPFYVQLQLWV